MTDLIDLEVLDDSPGRPRKTLPKMPDGRPVPVFFGRRFLTYRDLVAIGLISNDMTLRRLIAEGRFPAPLKLGRKIRLWDVLDLQVLIERLGAERDRHVEEAA